jgi:hypothetical protein
MTTLTAILATIKRQFLARIGKRYHNTDRAL